MKKDQLIRANEIEKEIEDLNKKLSPLKSFEDGKNIGLSFRVQGEGYDRCYGKEYEYCPTFLKESLDSHLQVIASFLIIGIEKRIKQLTKEFDNL